MAVPRASDDSGQNTTSDCPLRSGSVESRTSTFMCASRVNFGTSGFTSMPKMNALSSNSSRHTTRLPPFLTPLARSDAADHVAKNGRAAAREYGGGTVEATTGLLVLLERADAIVDALHDAARPAGARLRRPVEEHRGNDNDNDRRETSHSIFTGLRPTRPCTRSLHKVPRTSQASCCPRS